jgi:hypothetical protein
VVNAVAVSHGGWLDLAPNHPRGLRATLVLPRGSDVPRTVLLAPLVPNAIEPPT